MRTPLGTDEEATIYSENLAIDNDKHDLVKKTDAGTIHPQDTGLHAWLFLAGSFLIEGLALGEMQDDAKKEKTDRRILTPCALPFDRFSRCVRCLPGLLQNTPALPDFLQAAANSVDLCHGTFPFPH